MLRIILDSDWILTVAHRGGDGRQRFERAASERRNAQMNGDLRLERADLDYSTRAGPTTRIICSALGRDLGQYLADVIARASSPTSSVSS